MDLDQRRDAHYISAINSDHGLYNPWSALHTNESFRFVAEGCEVQRDSTCLLEAPLDWSARSSASDSDATISTVVRWMIATISPAHNNTRQPPLH